MNFIANTSLHNFLGCRVCHETCSYNVVVIERNAGKGIIIYHVNLGRGLARRRGGASSLVQQSSLCREGDILRPLFLITTLKGITIMGGSMRYLQDEGGMNGWVVVGGTSILRVQYVIKSQITPAINKVSKEKVKRVRYYFEDGYFFPKFLISTMADATVAVLMERNYVWFLFFA